MHAFDVLGDPVRRRILELLATGEQAAGAVSTTIQAEFGISQPAVSQHLKVLRDNGFTTVRAEGTRRLYALDAAAFEEADEWLSRFRAFWNQRLDALATELARGQRETRQQEAPQQEDRQRETRQQEDRWGEPGQPESRHQEGERQSEREALRQGEQEQANDGHHRGTRRRAA
ncbi:DNA-binding transcriptional ArsR family regulator [Hamadaea flava]|nr:DNA-binding transcriptional ArsR family regulator [Hamadaea flava]